MIEVTCAIIEHKGKVLICQRSELMSLPLMWEFPGGKVERNESFENCLIREIKEELNIDISIVKRLNHVFHKYDNKSITLIPFICTLHSSEIKLNEHKDLIWINPLDLLNYNLAPADIPIAKEYINTL